MFERMNAVILTCSYLKNYVDAAQEKMNTHFPVIEVDRKYHDFPKKMRGKLIEVLEDISPEVELVLVAMGFCGGSWEAIPSERTIVIPKVDDCITLLLHTDDEWAASKKKAGHMYLTQEDVGEYSVASMKRKFCEKYGEKKGMRLFDMMFDGYTNVDIIDTGVYDCYAEEYVEKAKENAQVMGCPLSYVEGSNYLLEKLVSGRWDHQFIVACPGRLLENDDFVLG